ncbi:LLM class flavin-dependent oxidoreductase [Desertimonas flava]|uniref:LLM class flavin-dependent oxidoreductase n=1 Tax=Desertimonas flava TaxID=2064846 RepID=UPI000E34DA0A|nr:LLM class flavin-dependent oxidoreductase [Desertimonas flava]
MRFSIWPSLNQSWADVVAVTRHAEATGWDRAYVADHFMVDGETADSEKLATVHEATAAIPALATITDRIGLATLVFGITYRHPAVLANWAATADHIAGGRLVLGVGAGWQENEHEQYGIELGRPGVRIDRFEEALTVIRSIFTQRETTFEGRHYQLTRAIAEPKPLQQHLPILIGGKGDRMMGVVARHADEWNMWGVPAQIAERRAALDAACERIGRDPSSIATSAQALWFFIDDESKGAAIVERVAPRAAVAGSVERLTEQVGAWRDAGVDEIIVPDFSLGTGAERTDRMDTIIEQIAPHFR